jgi:hypothetical protein
MKRINVLGEATEAAFAWSLGRRSIRLPRGAYVALVLVVMLGTLGALTASPAHATTVKGKFQYEDIQYTWDDTKKEWTQTVTDRPIARAKVEIWRFRSRCFLCPWTWAKDATTWTDANGSISLGIPFAGKGVVYGVRVFATNNAAIVYRNAPLLPTPPFHREPGEDNGHIIHKTEHSPSDVLDFQTTTFRGWSAQHFNIAEVARQGKLYADARRAPGETDPIRPANFQPTSAFDSYYNPVNDTVYINSADVNQDFLILHEYAHYLQEQISSFAPVPTRHTGCIMRTVQAPYHIINTPELAWMEGFADYFAQAVGYSDSSNTLSGSRYWLGVLERAHLYCDDLPSGIPGDAVEYFVAGTLFDLFDKPEDYEYEEHDTLARMDRQIFEIFDRELDRYVVWPPTITSFRHAWMDRSLPGAELDRIMAKHKIVPR